MTTTKTTKPKKNGTTCYLTIKSTIEARELIRQTIEQINPVLFDCEAQYNSLDQSNDVDWDCYNKTNWSSMETNLAHAIKLLKKLNNQLTGAKLQYNGIKEN